jgi:ankyrin repeat protein
MGLLNIPGNARAPRQHDGAARVRARMLRGFGQEPKPSLLPGQGDPWLAARDGRTDVLRNLVLEGKFGVDCAKPPFGVTPLHRAAGCGCDDVITLLVGDSGLGANVNATTFLSRETPLHYAATNGCAGACALLIRAGAKVHAKNKSGLTPVQKAMTTGYKLLALQILADDHEMRDKNNKAKIEAELAFRREQSVVS